MSRVLAFIILAATLGGCVVAPAPGPYPYARPAGVAYIGPTYAIPGPATPGVTTRITGGAGGIRITAGIAAGGSGITQGSLLF